MVFLLHLPQFLSIPSTISEHMDSLFSLQCCILHFINVEAIQQRTPTLAKMAFADERQHDRCSEEVEGDEVIVIKPLLWRSYAVNQMFEQLDEKIMSK